MRSPLFVILLAAVMTAPWLWGHQSPVHVVEDLSGKMATWGANVKLLTARAYEYNALGNWSAAAADFEAAIKLDPQSRSAIAGCAEAYFYLGNLENAELMCQRGLALEEQPAEQAPYYAWLARILTRRQYWPEALGAWQKALRSPQPEIDWYLGEANVLKMLGRSKERVEALSDAIERNPSIAIRRVWIQALVETGEFETASIEIERGLSQSRWQSFWLLLRAQIHEQNQNFDEQRADAARALTEIKSRLNADNPDPYLLAEASKALALLGDNGGAIVDPTNLEPVIRD